MLDVCSNMPRHLQTWRRRIIQFFNRQRIRSAEFQVNDNVIGKELQSILKPLNLIQALFVCAKYKLKNDRITPNTLKYNLASVLTTVINLSLLLHTTFAAPSLDSLLYIMIAMIGLGLNCYISITESENSVLLVIKIENVLKAVKSKNIRQFLFYNWSCIIGLHISMFILILYYSFFNMINYLELFNDYSLITFDVNILYAGILIKIVWNSLKLWLKELQQLEADSRSGNDVDSNYWNDKFETFMNIIEAYQLIDRTFRILVSSSSQILQYTVKFSPIVDLRPS